MDTDWTCLDIDRSHDLELMRRFGGGCDAAFAELVRRHQQNLVNLFRRLGADAHSAEDCGQETFVRLYKYRKSYRPSAPFGSFLYTLARNSWIDHVRARNRWIAAAVGDDRSLEVADERRDDKLDLGDAVAKLPESARWVLILSIHQGLNYAEIAEVLAIPLGTVKSRMFYAVRKLREVLHAKLEL